MGRNSNADIQADLAKAVPQLPPVEGAIHAAGKAHSYPKTQEEKEQFFSVNVGGTRNLLHALEANPPQYFVFISSVSVYGLTEGMEIDESAPIVQQRNGEGGYSAAPYAVSKAEAEQIVKEFCEKHGVHYLILRLPLIAGPNPPGNLGKMIRGIQSGRYLRIAKGEAKKSMVWAEDIAELIANWPKSEQPASGIYNLTDGEHPSFFELEEAIRIGSGKSRIKSIPPMLAQLAGKIGDMLPAFPVNSNTIKKITCTFTFSDQKARKELGWKPRKVLSQVERMLGVDEK